ncbi:MAG: polyketide cyclase / dehydrase and lipid transport [Actinobacteria bacterium]|nr:polyketide cyclase / dehydrase and lipid transport [Actinomycetota bacterium]
MPQLDLVDETFVVADPGTLASIIHEVDRWRRWWPDLRLSVFEDRAERGIRWNVAGALSGSSLSGSMEVWLEPFGDGVIVHYFLRADFLRASQSTRPAFPSRRAVREIHGWQRRTKRIFWSLKDEVEEGRPAGEPRSPDTDGV